MTVQKAYLDEIDTKVLKHINGKFSRAFKKELDTSLELTNCKTKFELRLKRMQCWYYHNVCTMWHYAFNFYLDHTGFVK